MKTIIIAVVIVIGMGVAVNIPFTAEVIQGEREQVIVEVEPEWATDEEAKQAAKDVIQRKALEADKSRLEGQIEALEDELEQVDKELGLH